jgi:uncharacterized protein (DUF2384 family)
VIFIFCVSRAVSSSHKIVSYLRLFITLVIFSVLAVSHIVLFFEHSASYFNARVVAKNDTQKRKARARFTQSLH